MAEERLTEKKLVEKMVFSIWPNLNRPNAQMTEIGQIVIVGLRRDYKAVVNFF
jgi:hypothetical protein